MAALLTRRAALAALAASPALAVPANAEIVSEAAPEHPWVAARRLSDELSLVLNDVDGAAWYAIVYPDAAEDYPVAFMRRDVRLSVGLEHPDLCLALADLARERIRALHGIYAGAAGDVDEFHRAPLTELNALAAVLALVPATSADGIAVKEEIAAARWRVSPVHDASLAADLATALLASAERDRENGVSVGAT